MGRRAVRVAFLLLSALFCYSGELNYESSISIEVAEAFLFQQLPPSYQELNSTPSNYLDNYSQLTYQPSKQNRAQATTNQAQSYYTRDSNNTNTNTNFDDTHDNPSCPKECNCREGQTADCSNRKLVKVPKGFSKDVKRIKLERNSITELGAYAFEGLKRLNRIDLSNNNIAKIDPLAFSGGLQSLNSLILYSNKLNQLPVNLFSELSQLRLLLLNANSIQCISKELFQPLTNLNLLSLYDNNIETLPNGTFDGLKNIQTIHLGKNPLACDCNLRWLADYLELNPVETSQASCASPSRNQGKKLSELSESEFKCSANEKSKANQIAYQCAAQHSDASCPVGCVCDGATLDCSNGASLTESRQSGNPIYELPDIPDDIPVYVTRMRINDNRIKRIRQTGLFRRLANSQKLDLGSNRIVDIEDNAINGAVGSTKPERVVFVLLENDNCNSQKSYSPEDACVSAPKVNPPNFDSPCYNGGSCISNTRSSPGSISSEYSCLCPPGFAGSLCEINIDDCIEHQCQNGGMCVDGINSYKCLCRDPTTTGEFCEQLNTYTTSSANSIAPIALPIIASSNSINDPQQHLNHQPQQILARSADFHQSVELPSNHCKRVTQREYYQDGNGCQSVRALKLSKCVGSCGSDGCCSPAKLKRRRIRMQCNDGASYVKTIDLVKKCACSKECNLESNQPQNSLAGRYNATQEDQLLQITRLDAVD